MLQVLSSLCFLYNLQGPPKISIQNGTYQLYSINRRICPEIDPLRDTIFELYTRRNIDTPDLLRVDESDSIANSNFDFSLPTVIFFHGFLESSQSDDAVQIKNNYLILKDLNVIIVNNERLLAGPYYLTSVANLEPIGKYSARLVDNLVSMGLQLSNLHVIGMSLGAHIAGFVGKYTTSGKIARITGLDPAGPIISFFSPDKRINKDDAIFVDIVHTNSGGNGIKFESGDVDIWVNGGSSQPGCSFLEVIKRVPGSISELVFCNHYQAYRMYVMSLIDSTAYPITSCDNYDDFLSGKCDGNDETYLGVDINVRSKGNYYIKTNVTAVDL